MSGPFIIQNGGDSFNGSFFNGVPYNGFGGIGVLYLQPAADSVVFELFVGGKLKIKEQFEGVKAAPYPRGVKSELLVPISRRVKP